MRALALGVLVAATILLSSCANGPSDNSNKNDVTGGRLYSVARATTSGGMCAQGSCTRSIEIFSDGRTLLDSGIDTNHPAMNSTEIAALIDAINKADLSTVPRQPTDYTCPTASDGTMTTYEFYGGAHPIVVDSCTYNLTAFEPVVLVENQRQKVQR